MPAVTQQELEDAQRDVTDLGKIVNGGADLGGTGTVTTRQGLVTKTVAKALSDVAKVSPAITYATAAGLMGDPAPQNGQLAYAADTDQFYIKNSPPGSAVWVAAPNDRTYISAIGNRFFGGSGNLTATGLDSTAFGLQAASALTTSAQNVAVGARALRDTTTGGDNVAVGSDALRGNKTGTLSVVVGSNAERLNQAGSQNVTVGGSAGLFRTTGSQNVAIGFAAMGSTGAGGDRNVAIGAEALSVYNGSDAVAVGYGALGQATGDANVAVGPAAGGTITTGRRNTFLGASAGAAPGQVADVENTIVIGNGAVSTQTNDIVLGTAEHQRLFVFGVPLFRYSTTKESYYAGNAANGGGIGDENGANVGIGPFALHRSQFTGTTVAIGRNAGYWATKLSGCVAIGADAMKNAMNDSPGVLPAGTVLGNPTDCTAIGAEAGRDWQGIVGAVAIGRISQRRTTTGTNNISVGDASLRDNVTGEANCAYGYGAICFNVTGSRNVGMGQGALYRGLDIYDNVAVGADTGEYLSGDRNVILGSKSARPVTDANDSIFIGANSGTDPAQKLDVQNSTAIGSGSFTNKDNQVVLGNANVTETVLRGVTKHKVFTVANLPAAAGAGVGARAFVSDATTTAFASVVAGGGANALPVYCDGAAWRIG